MIAQYAVIVALVFSLLATINRLTSAVYETSAHRTGDPERKKMLLKNAEFFFMASWINMGGFILFVIVAILQIWSRTQ